MYLSIALFQNFSQAYIIIWYLVALPVFPLAPYDLKVGILGSYDLNRPHIDNCGFIQLSLEKK